MSTETASRVETNIDLEQLVNPYEETDDGGKYFAHIVNPPMNTHIWDPGMDMKEVVSLARLHGLELVALCGYKWVPKRNPQKYPTCEPCSTRAGELMRSMGE